MNHMKLPVINFNCDVYYKEDDEWKITLNLEKIVSQSLLRTGWNHIKI